jgi:hypothetical protein
MTSHFKSLIAGGVCVAALAAAPVAHAAILEISVFDNGVLVGSSPPSTFGIATFRDNGTLDPAFAAIGVLANGPNLIPNPDLSSVTLDISAGSGFSGTHTLTIDIFQTGVSAPAGATESSTFTVNNLIGTPGPATLSDFINGTNSSLGTLLNSKTFPAGTVSDTVLVTSTLGTKLTADAEEFAITFSRRGQSANDTIQLTTSNVPEPSTWVMMALGFVGLGYTAVRRRSKNRSAVAI